MISEKGHTLIELAIFIVIMGLLTSGIFTVFTVSLLHMPSLQDAATSIGYAQQRMEFIIGQREIYGYSSFTDPCAGGSPPAFCTDGGGSGGATSSITTVTDGKQIAVTVASPYSITLNQLVTDY